MTFSELRTLNSELSFRTNPSGRGKKQRPKGKIVLLFIIMTLLALPPSGYGVGPSSTPPEPETSSLFFLGIEGYQKFLAPVLDSKCYMQPSCSAYSKQAFSEYGPFLGLLLTIDRLFHEANEDRTSPLIHQEKALKLYDPPAANVWWEKSIEP